MKTSRKKIINYIIWFSVIFAALSVNFYVLYTHVKDNAISAKEREVMKAASEFGYFLVESVDAIRLASDTVEQLDKGGASSKEILDYLTQTSNAYAATIDRNFTGFYGFIKGEYLDGSGWVPDADYDPKSRPWYKEALEASGEVAFVSPYVDSQTGSVTMSICQQLSNEVDVISMDTTLDDIQRLLEEATIQNEWKYGMILDGDGMVVAHSEMGEIGKNYREDKNGIGKILSDEYRSGSREYVVVRYDDDDYIAIPTSIGGGWNLVAVINASDSLGSMKKVLLVFILTLIVIFSAVITAIVKMRKKQENEQYLTSQMKAFAYLYDYAFLIDLKKDEFQELTETPSEILMFMEEDNKSAQYNVRAIMDAVTDKRYKKTVFDFIDLKTLDERLKEKNAVSMIFVRNDNRKLGIRFTQVERDLEGKLLSVIFMAEDLENV